jgi:hypothetical protein
MKRFMVLVVFSMVGVMVQVGCATAETKGQGVDAPSIRQALLNPKGFDMDWLCGGKSGHSVVYFREDGEKIVAEIRVVDIENVDINNPINFGAESCTSYTKLTDRGIIFYGCSSDSWDIPLAYDPENKKTPFKGSGVNCQRIGLSPR